MRLHLDLELLTDACLAGGAPGGPGGVDTATETDGQGMPVLRGRTMKGLLVEEAAMIVTTLGDRPLQSAASTLFGDPGRHGSRALLSFADGSVPPVVRQAFVAHGWDGQVLTRVRRQTAIDHEKGVAKDGSLRATRLLRHGLTLRCSVSSPRELAPDEQALLAACVASVRRIGLHRNEGWGRVRCRLRDDSGADVTERWLRSLDAPRPSAPPPTAPLGSKVTAQRSGGRTVVTFDLLLERPAVFPDRASGNWVVSTLPYVPGSALLGACATRWLAAHRNEDPSIDETFRRLFLDGTVRWLDALPVHNGAATRVAPQSWRVDDPEAPQCQRLDLAHPDAHELVDASEPGQWKAVPVGSFAVEDDEGVTLLRPQTTERMHHQRDRDKGRSDDGELFVVEALDAGVRLRGAVRCESAGDAAIVASMLEGVTLELGRSRTATYGGGARVENVQYVPAPPVPRSCAGWILGADYLGRTDDGTPDPGQLLRDLGRALGLEPDALADARRFVIHRTVHGSVGKWQMPRPAHIAVAAGSVVMLPEGLDVAPDRLAELAWRGIGERRAEGFGCVLPYSPTDDATVRAELRRTASAALDVAGFDDDTDQLAMARRQVGLAAIRSKMIEDATAVGGTLRPQVAPSLIGRLRHQVRAAGSLREVRVFIDSIASKKAGRDLGHVEGHRPFTQAVLDRCERWQGNFVDQLPNGVSMDDLAAVEWSLQQAWLDAVLERWRRAAQRHLEEA